MDAQNRRNNRKKILIEHPWGYAKTVSNWQLKFFRFELQINLFLNLIFDRIWKSQISGTQDKSFLILQYDEYTLD